MEGGAFLFLPQSVPAPQNHRHLHLVLMPQWGNVAYLVLVQWWEMTGKFRKVASHSAQETSLWAVPKLARGLRPLEPRHVNGVSIPTEHLLID